MRTLGIETSTARGSIAIIDGSEVLFHAQFSADRSAALFVHLEAAAPLLSQCERIAVGLGPGSYAGVRVAIAAALGLHFTNPQATLVGISSFAALETSAPEFFTVGDARSGGFYFAHFANEVLAEGPLLLPLEQLRQKLSRQPELPVCTSSALPDVLHAQLIFPSAERIARLAAADRSIYCRDVLAPIYLRDPIITRPDTRLRP